ncbi:SDR family oxidoreductase [Enterovibrio makurazakiensis]|uniref:SDR family NAD(P)-dependent oxidoreductase n=1 Tax=Enterovibrio makurazakiensis TaxID=2910232 RepID=UPI003D1E758D
MNINGAVALVTGGCGGLGSNIAEHLSSLGAKVVIADLDNSKSDCIPDKFIKYSFDVTDPDQVKNSIGTIVKEHGPIEILVNCAGSIDSAPFVNLMNPNQLMLDYDRFKSNMLINLDSVFLVTSSTVEHMLLNRVKGCIVNISSISANGNEGQCAYSSAKAAVNALTITLSKELGKLGIRVNAVSPGFIGTDSTSEALSEAHIKYIISNTPIRRLGKAVEVSKAVASLVENDFINGVILDVNGGLTI